MNRQRPMPKNRPEADDGAWWIGIAAVAIILLFSMVDPGLEWLANGAPDNRPQAEQRTR